MVMRQAQLSRGAEPCEVGDAKDAPWDDPLDPRYYMDPLGRPYNRKGNRGRRGTWMGGWLPQALLA